MKGGGPALEVLRVSKTYGGRAPAGPALADVSFHVAEGAFFTLLGPSGCGKTTLLKCIAGLEEPSSGDIRIGGQDVYSGARRVNVPSERRPVGMVFQSYAIWPHMTVFDNVAFPLRYGHRRLPAADVRRRAGDMLERLGLAEFAERWATQLSGGQQQRLAVARALVGEPRLLLLDEPLSNLDAQLRALLRGELKRFQKLFGVTTVYVTHDQNEALSLSDEIVVLDRGAIQQTGAPRDLYDRPATPFVAGFVGAANLLAGRLRRQDGGPAVDCPFGTVICGRGGVPAGVPAGGEVLVCVRPEAVRLHIGGDATAPAVNGYRGRIGGVEFLGDRCECTVRVGDADIRVRTPPDSDLHEGEAVWIVLPADQCRVLDAGPGTPDGA